MRFAAPGLGFQPNDMNYRLPQQQARDYFNNNGYFSDIPNYYPEIGHNQNPNFMMGGYNDLMLPMMNNPIINMLSMQNAAYQNIPKEPEAESNYNEVMTMSIEEILKVFDQKIIEQKGCK